jgi:hypothetical protein
VACSTHGPHVRECRARRPSLRSQRYRFLTGLHVLPKPCAHPVRTWPEAIAGVTDRQQVADVTRARWSDARLRFSRLVSESQPCGGKEAAHRAWAPLMLRHAVSFVHQTVQHSEASRLYSCGGLPSCEGCFAFLLRERGFQGISCNASNTSHAALRCKGRCADVRLAQAQALLLQRCRGQALFCGHCNKAVCVVQSASRVASMCTALGLSDRNR